MTTYEFYRNEYGGTADEVSFLAAVSSAESVLRALLYPTRPEEMSEPRKNGFCRAVCMQADYSASQTGGTGGRRIKSESIGGHSVTYAEADGAAGGVTVMGIAVSPEAVMLLTDCGCLSRWV